MKPPDRSLGMDRPISRRDLLHGIGALTANALVPGRALADEIRALEQAGESGALHGARVPYPPARTGMRGNHAGSFEVAHQLAREGRRDWGTPQAPDSAVYDLVVVGAGISGLAAAHFFRKQKPEARILILDNHDDFGGHAKRNEFQVQGRSLIGYGGSQTLEAPGSYSGVVKGLLRDLGVDTSRFDTAYDQDFYRRHGLAGGIYFNREAWGEDLTLPYSLGLLEDYLQLAASPLSPKQAIEQMPISQPAKRELLRLLTAEPDDRHETLTDAQWRELAATSYRDFLRDRLGISQADVFRLLQDLTADSGLGIEATSAPAALYYSGLPGVDAAGLPRTEAYEAYIHHFPDGNASIARLLVRGLIPSVAPAATPAPGQDTAMDDIVAARFDYSKLDLPDSSARLRLDSTVVRVEHEADPKSAKHVGITYVRNGQSCRVRARSCVLACYSAMIPHLCPELPAPQRAALALQVKVPILYTTVALRNWRAWKRLGIAAAVSPGSYYVNAALDFPVSLAGYSFSAGPDEPIAVHMERFPHRPNSGLTAREQHRLGRHELLSTSFSTIERNTRSQLAGMLGKGGFDAARDIEGITVNRWAHGYSYMYNPLFDTVHPDDDDERYPHMRARNRFGRIAIANADAAATAMLEAAVEQGHRAVSELV